MADHGTNGADQRVILIEGEDLRHSGEIDAGGDALGSLLGDELGVAR
jgi:hypothetical protein